MQMVLLAQYWHILKMKIDFSEKTVIITGGTRGIGSSLVSFFEKTNANVIATGTNKADLEKLSELSLNKKIKYFHLDFTKMKSINHFIDYLNSLENIDVLINNAGVNKINKINDIEVNDWDWIYNVNLRGPFILTKSVSRIMMKKKYGRIVNIGSIFGEVSKSKRAAYSTTKWGLIGFTKAVGLDLAKDNILVNTISPGFVDTELTKRILTMEEIEDIISTIPLNRLALPDEIAKTVLFLASDQNTYITGQNIIIDGGFTSA